MSLRDVFAGIIVVCFAMPALSQDQKDETGRTIPASIDIRLGQGSMAPALVSGAFAPMLYSYVPTDTLLVGDGFNSATNEGLSSCVDFSGEKDLTRAAGEATTGQKVQYNFVQLKSFSDLKTYLSVSASASVGYGIFSADASYKMMSSGQYSHFSNYVLLDVLVQNPTEQLKTRHLTKSALRYAAAGRQTFLDMCGNEFIYARQTGGHLSAILEFTSSSTAEQTAQSAHLDATIGAYGSGSADVAKTVASLQKESAKRLHIIRDGGLGALPNPDTLLEASLNYGNLVRSRSSSRAAECREKEKAAAKTPAPTADQDPCVEYEPVVFNLVTRSYRGVDNLPTNLRDFSTIEEQERVLSAIGIFLDKAYSIRGDLTYYQTHPEQFVDYSKDDWNAAWKSNESKIDSLMADAQKCRYVRKLEACKLPSPPSFEDIYTPKRKEKSCEQVYTSGESGHPYTEVFDVAMAGRGGDHSEQGTFHLATPDAKITSIVYKCVGAACGWSYNPAGGYPANVVLIDNDKGFIWYRKYQNSTDIAETYTAFINVLTSCPK